MISWADLTSQVNANDPAAFRWFGALLDHSIYSPAVRTTIQQYANDSIVRAMPKFALGPGTWNDSEKAFLWECVKANNGGKNWTNFFQETGSCVGNGLGQATSYLMAVEAWLQGQRESVKYPLFYGLPYGRSRFYLGERGPGEGSTGGTAAKAIVEDGILASDFPGLPPYKTISGGLSIGRKEELHWSYIPDGSGAFAPFQGEGKLHPAKSAAPISSADSGAVAVRNGYTLTIASNWGGQMKCQVTSDPPVLLNKRSDTWPHQMCIIGTWRHPKLGDIFYVLNSWGPTVHGECPTGAPPGGFWITKADLDWICRDGEVFAISSFEGFPARVISWADIVL